MPVPGIYAGGDIPAGESYRLTVVDREGRRQPLLMIHLKRGFADITYEGEEKMSALSVGVSREKAMETLKTYNSEAFHIRHALSLIHI